MTICCRFIQRLQRRALSLKTNPITVNELNQTESKLIKLLQENSFSEEMKYLKVKQGCTKASPLCKLDPFIDDNGLLRVGGRLQSHFSPYNVNHTVILPKNEHLTSLIISYYHERVHHQGKGITVNEIRANGYWILGVTRAVATYIYKCVTCKRLKKCLISLKIA